jgi:hypothetical protein
MGRRNGSRDEWLERRNEYQQFSTTEGALCGAQKRRLPTADQAVGDDRVDEFGRKSELKFD